MGTLHNAKNRNLTKGLSLKIEFLAVLNKKEAFLTDQKGSDPAPRKCFAVVGRKHVFLTRST